MPVKSLQRIFAYLIFFDLLIGCTSEPLQSGGSDTKPANRPPSILSASITPLTTRAKSLSVQVDARDPDGDLISYRHQWSRNGNPIPGQTGSILASQIVKRGDRLAVEIIPFDGKNEGRSYRAEAVVGNTPPEVTRVVLEPREVRMGGRLQANVEAFDPDQDGIEYRFRWWRNNKEISEGTDSELEIIGFERGDVINVQVTPYDESGTSGKAALAEPVAIANSSPHIKSTPPIEITNGKYEYPVAAIDPDGDQLIFSLEASPTGMKIDKNTGRIEWRIPPETKGLQRVRTKVVDSQDAFAFQEFDLIFSAQLPS